MMWFASSSLRRTLAFVAIFVGGLVAAADASAQVERPDKRGRYYRVRIDSSPQQATIYLDDKNHGVVGQTPWEGRLQKGNWKIILEKDGYKTEERQFRVVRTRQLQEAFLSLGEEEQPARLSVSGAGDPNAKGAKVYVSGEEVGEVPLDVEVDRGRHLVEVKKEGFEDFSEWVSAEEGETVTLNPMLRGNAKGQILVDADVSGATVYLDGEKQSGSVPMLIDDVAEGVRELEVRGSDDATWKQRVEVTANETTEVEAVLTGEGVTVRVMTNVEGARVYLDGSEVGEAPIDIDEVRPGEHVVQVRAEGYTPREERIEVKEGQQPVVKLDLEEGGDAELRIVSPVPEAMVFVDGERIGTAPQTQNLSAGQHFIVVSKEGYRDFQEQIEIESGEERTVSAELRRVGEVRFVSRPSGAEVFLDGERIGVTPFTHEEVTAGEHVATISLSGHRESEHAFSLEGGQTEVVNARLEMLDTGPTAAEIEREVRSLTSFGARTLPRGRSTIDMAVGYPYYLDGRITVGADDFYGYGFDAGVFFRTLFSRSEVGLSGRLRFFEDSPFSFGAFGKLGGGGNFFDDSHRNTFFTDLGVVGSLTALKYVTVSGRAYLNMWSDRHCPELEQGSFPPDSEPVGTCDEYLREQATGDSNLSDEDLQRLGRLIDNPFERESGVRGMLSGVIELALERRWNAWLVFEGAPFQSSRPGYTNYFNGSMFRDDIGTYLRLGATLKF